MARLPTILLGMILVLATAKLGAAQALEAPSAFDPEASIRYSQAALGRELGDYTLLDRENRPYRLSEQRGELLVINLVYTACTHTCPLIVQTLYDAVEIAQDALGQDSFKVLTIGFDTEADSPARMRAYAASQGVDLPNWRFLSADEETMARLTADLGFIYYSSPKGFDHLAQTTVVDRQGLIYSHVYGDDFDAPALVEPLKDLVFGRQGNLVSLEGLINRVRLFCTLYDPSSERYRFDYSIFIGLTIGAISLTAIAVLLGLSAFRSYRRERGA